MTFAQYAALCESDDAVHNPQKAPVQQGTVSDLMSMAALARRAG